MLARCLYRAHHLIHASKRALHVSCNEMRRCRFTTSALDAPARNIVDKLSESQPCFSLSSSRLKILHEPSQFYQCLLVGSIFGGELFDDIFLR